MILIKNGKFFIEGNETYNPELIGLAFLDEVEGNRNVIYLKEERLLKIIENQSELDSLNDYINKETKEIGGKICNYETPFDMNLISSFVLFNLIEMIKRGQLIFKNTETP